MIDRFFIHTIKLFMIKIKINRHKGFTGRILPNSKFLNDYGKFLLGKRPRPLELFLTIDRVMLLSLAFKVNILYQLKITKQFCITFMFI